MDINQNNINLILNKYIEFTNKLSREKNYYDNIKHLLYIIIPAFVIKYGIKSESTILKCFSDTEIIINEKEEETRTAYYIREFVKQKDNSYTTKKYIVLHKYYGIGVVELIDNIVHEFNHAINSMINEIKIDDEFIYMRTGLSYLKYSKSNPKQFIDKSYSVTLEEIINTKQTELILDIINNFSNFNIDNIEFNNVLYTIKHEIDSNSYRSSAYLLQSYICKELMNNKTFIPTIESLRFSGNIEDIEIWFDNIIGESGSYKRLSLLLNKVLDLELAYTRTRFFKNHKLKQIKKTSEIILGIVRKFDNSCIYK